METNARRKNCQKVHLRDFQFLTKISKNIENYEY